MFQVKQILFGLYLSVTFVACQKDPALFNIQNLNGNTIAIYGHGGMGICSLLPINTYPSLEKSLDKGADGTEIDVQVTSDGVLVAYHGLDLKDMTDCTGIIANSTWKEISTCSYTSALIKKYKLFSLKEIFDRLKRNEGHIFTFDCKLVSSGQGQGYQLLFADALINLIHEYELADNVFIESQSEDFLALLRNKDENLKLFIYPPSFEEGLKVAETLKLYGITIDVEKISRDNVDAAHNKGFRVTLWNANTRRKNIDAIKKSPDFIQTDNLQYLLKVLK